MDASDGPNKGWKWFDLQSIIYVRKVPKTALPVAKIGTSQSIPDHALNIGLWQIRHYRLDKAYQCPVLKQAVVNRIYSAANRISVELLQDREKSILDVITGKQRMDAQLAALLSNEGVRVLKIARDRSRSSDSRLREIAWIDNRVYTWTSERLGDFLGVSDSAIRQTNWWQQDRKEFLRKHGLIVDQD